MRLIWLRGIDPVARAQSLRVSLRPRIWPMGCTPPSPTANTETPSRPRPRPRPSVNASLSYSFYYSCVCVCVLAAPVYPSTTHHARHTHHTHQLHLHLRHPRLRSQFHANRLLASFTHPSPQKQPPTLSSASSPQPRLARLARPPVQPVCHMTPAPSSAGTSLGSRLRRLRLTAESRDARPLVALWHPRPAKVLVQVQDHLERIAAP
jgi:hypothetical protein